MILKLENENRVDVSCGHVKNEMEVSFDAISENESFARMAVAAFAASLNPTLEELADIKTAVSEAVTNAIIHGYDNVDGYGIHGSLRPCYVRTNPGKVKMSCSISSGILSVEVSDEGRGIADIKQAMEPLFTTKAQYNRSGMGFAFMEAFMDELHVESTVGKGTKVCMKKKIGTGEWIARGE